MVSQRTRSEFTGEGRQTNNIISDPEQKGPIRTQDGDCPPTVSETNAIESAPSNSSSGSDSSLSQPTPPSSTDCPLQGDGFTETVEGGPQKQDEVDNGVTKTSILTATLYCPENGHPHSNVLCFGIMNGDDGNSPDSKDPGNSDEVQAADEAESEEGEEDEMGEIPAHLKVGHCVEYRDLDNGHIMSETWDRPFRLSRERNRALSKSLTRNKETVFITTTVLHTTVFPNHLALGYFGPPEFREKGSIIGNPKISVAIKYTKIEILSSLFIDALKSVLLYDMQDKLESGKLELNEPFYIIGHHLEELEKYVQQADNTDKTNLVVNGAAEDVAAASPGDDTSSVARETRIHVRLVLSFVNKILKDPITKERECYARDEPVCTFRMMWYLFRPGDTVYIRSDKAEDAYVVDSVEIEGFSLSSTNINCDCVINLWYLDFNGECISRAWYKAFIRPFKGEKRITSLIVVPCRIWDQSDGAKLRASLDEREKKWVDHLVGKQVEYRGEPFKPGRKPVEGRAYADPASYYSIPGNTPDCMFINSMLNILAYNYSNYTKVEEKQSKVLYIAGATYDNLSVKSIGNFVDDSGLRIAYMLCSRKLKGFVFSMRVWETLDIRYCYPVTPDKNLFGRLVMPNECKMMIKALVYKYTDPDLVSIFLREIEYYQGILFLTSNCMGKFDDAIISRIHVIIYYQGLDDEYRKKIWN
ncbi:hypothetical protein MFIFM68171_08387 [Madurella fahalii]|uniref:DUF7025 domain-containing protein n=1 Tax=Madurella fahalii TaxID=1157608 RepID=A0ABQ0GKB6_9PEZI